MELNYYGEYILSVDIDSFDVLNLKDINDSDIKDLAELYCTLFNSDNKYFLKQKKIKGRTLDEGLWNEKPFEYNSCLSRIKEYISDDFLGVYAIGFKGTERFVLGAIIMKKSSIQEMTFEGFECPFDLSIVKEFWMGVDTFKREFTVKGRRALHFSSIMRHKLIEIFKRNHHTLMFSSTSNPVMVKAWKKENFYVIDKNTKNGNKFQGFKII